MSITDTVWLVDDDEEVRRALTLLLRSAGYRVQAYPSGESLIDTVTTLSQGCLLIDIRLTGMDGLAVQRELIRRHIDMPRLFISGHGDIPLAVKAIREGGEDFLEKPFNEDQLLQAVGAAVKKDREWRANHADSVHLEALINTLTPREKEVMSQLLDGNQSKQIAEALGAGVRTIEAHRTRILEKMEMANSAELISRVLTLRSATPRGRDTESDNPE
ncbi:response regulator [Spiribacter sp. 1M153]|uniref:response regulator transcription factor n=1 Tax=Spiribacter roseus TaxID=1855875 RepID=UPI00349F8EDC